jgi:hypothetical protein
MGYYGDFVEVPFDHENMAGMIAETKRLLDAGTPVICEAAFSHDGNLCLVDILKVVGDGADIIEVKSSTSAKEIYLHDIAYQYWVVSHFGLAVKSARLMHINNQYVRRGALNLHELFAVEEMTDEVLSMQDGITGTISMLKHIASQPEEPDGEIGLRCLDPYECGYRGWCWRDMPSPNVFDIGGVGALVGSNLMDKGIVSFEDVLAKKPRLSARQYRQVRTTIDDLPPHIDEEAIAGFLDTLSFPLYFLDFETFMPAIPPFDGTHPYQQIPSQYSLHILESDEAKLQHREFLGKEGSDPRRELAEHLCADIPFGVCTLAYNMSFEKRVIVELAEMFPDLAAHLMGIHADIKDLMAPFAAGDYYSKELQGSYSIKYVLPALFPDSPELDYNALEGIHNGSDAMNAFADLAKHTPTEIAQIRAQLLAYCKLDTLAMVRIWEKLRELIQ